ncbi:MAG TPA: SMP-30/gluconolactonase/LRE family protein [Solirubrobacteraceae bacterium]
MALLSPPEPVPAVLARPHSLLEAPRIAGDGSLIYSDVIAGGVWRARPDGDIEELLPKRRGVGGIVPHADGGWVLSGRTVVHCSPEGSQRELLADEHACGYNDISTTAAGELLAGVLRYRPLAGEPPRPGALVRLGLDGALSVLSEDVVWPNGIGVSPDGATVYISDYSRAAVLAVPSTGGSAGEFCGCPDGSADGLAVDCEGGVWVALGDAGAVARFHADGRLDEVIDIPAGFVSSVSFGGPDMCDVLITTADNRVSPDTGGTLLRARSEIAGLAVAPARV